MNSQSERDFSESSFLTDIWEARSETILDRCTSTLKARSIPV
jgi:hypothetical protein